MRRFRDLLIFALCILLALAPMVSANSGPTYWDGTTASGMLVTGEDCPIVVEHENLTFHISELPEKGLWDDEKFFDYDDRVTAEYTFYNPTDGDVTVKLLFPFGVRPVYVPDGMTDFQKYTVTADGQPVETVLRHSLSWGDFDMGRDSARLHEGFMEHDFYGPDLPVTKYILHPEGVDWAEYDTVRAKVRLDTDPSRTKYIVDPGNSFSTEKDHTLAGGALGVRDTAEMYIIGQIPEKSLEWTLFWDDKPIKGTMELVSTEQMTLMEYILSTRPEGSDASDADWYNASVQMMDRSECGYGYLDVIYRLDLMCWYEYELTIPAGERLDNTVTAPLYPDVHSGWDPPIYHYKYLLSPAKGWADFGSLDIFIRSRYILRECNLDGFEDTGYGYELHLDGLPEKELEFVLCSSAHPDPPGGGAAGMIWFAGILGAVLAVGWVLMKRR